MNEDILDYATTNGVKKETLDNFIANTPEIEQIGLVIFSFYCYCRHFIKAILMHQIYSNELGMTL